MEDFSSDLIGQRNLRIDKLNKLIKLGIDPYPSKSIRTNSNGYLIENFESLGDSHQIIAGRVTAWRGYGKLIFIDITDSSEKIQVFIKEDDFKGVGSIKSDRKNYLNFDELDLLDIGDFVEVEGILTKTKKGEISIHANSVRLLTKTLRPFPKELTDKEERYRKRYLDMNIHPEIRKRFERRTKFWQSTRDFLNKNNFLEINIPVLEHTTGGADANPFVTHYNALDQDFYLRISHELPLKRLLGAGFEKVYDIGPRFRNEGFSDEHLPEHIAMEWYWAYADYKDGMEFTKELFRYVLYEVYGTLEFEVKGFKVDLSNEWKEIDFIEVIRENFNIKVLEDSEEKMKEVLIKNGVTSTSADNRSRLADSLWKLIRKNIGGPAFLVNVPKILSPLAKANQENSELVDRFHPIICGSEMGNAFSELNDPIDQFNRFKEQQSLREAGDSEAQMMDIDFVEMLEYGMPPAVGYGHSERVFWIFEGVTAKEGVPFPQLKSEISQLNREIYQLDK